MTERGYLGLDGKGKAPRWRLTELGFMNDPPTKDFLRWRGAKFRDQKNQNPGPENAATLDPKTGPLVDPKTGPPKARSGPENGSKGRARSGPENGAITKSHHLVGPTCEPAEVALPDAPPRHSQTTSAGGPGDRSAVIEVADVKPRTEPPS